MTNINIRKATNQDAKHVADLIFQIWVDEYGFKVNRDDLPDLILIEEYYQNKGGNFLVATVDEEIVGTIACDRLDDKTYILKRMFLKSSFRGQGIAQALIDKLLVDFKSGTSFFLSTKEDLALAAKKLYLRNGFQVVDKNSLPIGFSFFYEDDLFMRKVI